MWHLIKNRASYVFMFVPMVLGCMLVPVTWAQFEEAPQLPTSHQPAPASVSEGRVGIAEMNNLLSGNTLKVRMVNEEVKWSVFFQSGGLVFAKSEHGAQDTGQWWIDKGLYCTQYLQMREGKEACYWLSREEGQLRVHRSDNDHVVGLAELVPGNPEQLGQ